MYFFPSSSSCPEDSNNYAGFDILSVNQSISSLDSKIPRTSSESVTVSQDMSVPLFLLVPYSTYRVGENDLDGKPNLSIRAIDNLREALLAASKIIIVTQK